MTVNSLTMKKWWVTRQPRPLLTLKTQWRSLRHRCLRPASHTLPQYPKCLETPDRRARRQPRPPFSVRRQGTPRARRMRSWWPGAATSPATPASRCVFASWMWKRVVDWRRRRNKKRRRRATPSPECAECLVRTAALVASSWALGRRRTLLSRPAPAQTPAPATTWCDPQLKQPVPVDLQQAITISRDYLRLLQSTKTQACRKDEGVNSWR